MAMFSLEPAPALELFYEHVEDSLPLQQENLPVADDTIPWGWNSVSSAQEFHLPWDLVKGKALA